MATYAGRYSEDLQDRHGNGYRNALVAVETLAGAAVTLYADRDKTAYTPASGLEANEIKADNKGNLIFFADPGNYQIVVTPVGGSTLAAFPISVLPDPLEPDASEGALQAEEDARIAGDAALDLALESADVGISIFDVARLRATHQPPLTIPTSDGSGQAVHPDVRVLKEPWNGYRYWMAMTPYPGGDETVEMPEILASNDGITWVVPAGLVNPIATVAPPGFLPDPCLIFVGDTLWCIYATKRAKSSTDGVTWTAEQTISVTGGFSAGALSATVEEKAGTYYLWVVDTGSNPNELELYIGSQLLSYGSATTCNITGGPVGRDLWHIAVRRVVGGWVGVFAYTDLGGSARAECHLAYSNNGVDWTVGVTPLLGLDASNPDFESAVYRSCFVPTDNRGGVAGQLWYSGHNKSLVWRIAYTDVLAFGPESLPELVRTDQPGYLETQVLTGNARNKAINATLLKPNPANPLVPEGYSNNWVGGSGHAWVPSEQAYTVVTGTSGNMVQSRSDLGLVAGDWWSFSFEFRDAGVVGQGINPRLVWYAAGGVLLVTNMGGWWHSSDYRRIHVSAQVPATAVRVDATFGNAGASQKWFRRVQLEKSERPTVWTPEGGVTVILPTDATTRNGVLEALGPLTTSGAPRRTAITNEGAVVLADYTTATRPSAVTLGERAVIYDTTLNLPIFSDGAVWRNFAGTAV